MPSLKRLSLIPLAALSLFVASPALANDAAQSRIDASRSGANAESVDFAGASFTLPFNAKLTAGRIAADPIVIGRDVIAVGDNAGDGSDVVCINGEDGSTKWRVMLDGRVMTSPAAAENVVVVASTDGNVYGLNRTDGSELWKIQHGGFQVAAPAIEGTRVLIAPGFGSESLLCLDLYTGTELWRASLDRFVNSAPAVLDGKVVLALPNGSVQAFDLESGANLWKTTHEAKGVFYGVSPTIAHYASSGETFVYIAPGGEEVDTGATLAGFSGYVTYRLDLDSGALARIVPSKDSVAASSKAGTPAESATDAAKPDMSAIHSLPPKVKQEINRYTDTESKIKALESWEKLYGFDFSAAKESLRKLAAKRVIDIETINAPKRFASTSGGVFQPHDYNENWPSTETIRPAPAAFIERGNSAFLAVMMREFGSEAGATDRTFLFSLDPKSAGEMRWFYSRSDIAKTSDSRIAGATFVGKSGDADGAWLVAALGNCVAAFDAAGNNTPAMHFEMPAVVSTAPVYGNGLLVVGDEAGNLKIMKSPNAAPSAPKMVAPLAGIDVTSGSGVELSWNAASDDTTAANALRYQVRVASDLLGVRDLRYFDVGAGSTTYSLSALTQNSDHTISVRAIDEDGVAGAWSSTRSFSFYPDRDAPLPPASFTLTGGPLSLTLNFAASGDEAPSGDQDVTGYKVEVVDLDGSDFFTLDIGLVHQHTIMGGDVNTPLIADHNYGIRLRAYDSRGNESHSLMRSAKVIAAGDFDVTPPTVVSATLRDLAGVGKVDTVEIVFSEAINTSSMNVSGFKLAGVSARSASVLSPTRLRLDFGSGVTGTSLHELTYDAGIGSILDLKGNPLASFAANSVTESDGARPRLLAASIVAHDNDSNGHADRLTMRFSEPVDPTSLELGDVLAIRDGQGVELTATALSLSEDGLELTITLSNDAGSLSGIEVELSDNGNGNFVTDLNGNALNPIESNIAPVVVVATTPNALTIKPGVFKLNATGSYDPDGDDSALSFSWTIASTTATNAPTFIGAGSTTEASGSTATLILNQVGFYGVRLEVRDAGGRLSYKNLSIRVINQAPVANAGRDQMLRVGNQLTLNGSLSRDPNDVLGHIDLTTFAWEVVAQPNGANALITNANAKLATLDTTGLPTGDYEFKLTVQDRSSAMSSDRIKVTLVDDDTLIGAVDLGPTRRASVGQDVVFVAGLRGFTEAANVVWSTSNASLVNVVSQDGANATLNFLAVGNYQVNAVVSEGARSASASVDISVSEPGLLSVPENIAQLPSEVDVLELLSLPEGSSFSSSPLWTIQAAPTVTVAPAAPGIYELVLKSERDGLQSLARTQVVQVHGSTHLPQARATGPRSASLGETIELDLSASFDADGHNMRFFVMEWMTLGAQIEIEGTILRFTPRFAGKHKFAVVAEDDFDVGVGHEVEIMVHGTAAPQVQTSTSSNSVDLNTTNSIDLSSFGLPAGTMDALWVQVQGPAASIASPHSASTSVTLPSSAGTYGFALYALSDGSWTQVGELEVVATGAEAQTLAGDTGSSSGCSLQSGIGFGALGTILLALMGVFVYRRRRESLSE